MSGGERPWCVAIANRKDNVLSRFVGIVSQGDQWEAVFSRSEQFAFGGHFVIAEILKVVVCPDNAARSGNDVVDRSEKRGWKILSLVDQYSIEDWFWSLFPDCGQQLVAHALEGTGAVLRFGCAPGL